MGGVILHDVAKSQQLFTRFFTDFWHRLGSLRTHQDRSKRAEGSSEKLREAQKSSWNLREAQGSSGMLRCTHAPTHECMPACPHARTDACTQARKHSHTHARKPARAPAISLKSIRFGSSFASHLEIFWRPFTVFVIFTSLPKGLLGAFKGVL